ncbi:MAG: hypothetical protein IKP71_04610, partial [Candidatus Riflebacteria bacterium]|nr:hypothetical protein [Candidatus Riflebacteria bacterium]
MKKIIIVLSILVLSLSSCFAESTNVLPKDTNYLFSFDYEWANKNLVIGNEFTKLISTLKTFCKNKFSLDFDKEVKRIIFFKKNDEYLCAVSGNNVENKIFSFSNLGLKPVDNNFFIQTPKEIIALIEQGKAFVYIDGKSLPEVAGGLVATVTGMSSMNTMFTDVPAEVKQENPAFQMLDGIKYLLAFFDEDSIKVEVKCTDSDISEQVMNYLETFRTLYSSNLQKAIDGYREIMKKSNFADFAMISFTLYVHSKSKKFIDSIERSLDEDETVAFIKSKLDISYIIRSVASIKQSVTLASEKFLDFETATDHMNKYMCHRGQRYLTGMIEDDYNLDNKIKMTSLDEKKFNDFIESRKYKPL